ncbi:hypothetical protein X925_05220 [Petrotoga sp. 9T1HF07.CasAA.8.2]|uniref:hypothetical protein n=1 Tax=Petrotoga sp. 9T1HF07.CasAA.8.2 TaxID=1434329 RepID=UPI000CB921EB|nr:hypothetical protein [Petrotoga sp. 9T1HF07.CasAA.8.2]PNR88811.1 hypothetical protein X925_05220 [Petrotoga sp. 9T1HF07.CasAA.8.2]
MNGKFNKIERFFEGILPDGNIATFMKIIKFPSTVSDFLFEIKIKRFLSEIDRITQGEKDKFKEKIKNKNDLKYLGFKLLNIINDSDDENKCVLISRLFILFIEEKLNERDFFRISYLINRSYYKDLFALKSFSNQDTISTGDSIADKDVLESLFSYGFIENRGIDGGNSNLNSGGTIYSINRYGIIVRDIL